MPTISLQLMPDLHYSSPAIKSSDLAFQSSNWIGGLLFNPAQPLQRNWNHVDGQSSAIHNGFLFCHFHGNSCDL